MEQNFLNIEKENRTSKAIATTAADDVSKIWDQINRMEERDQELQLREEN